MRVTTGLNIAAVQMAGLTSSIYWPLNENVVNDTSDITQILGMANHLKKNRVLYHVLKERESKIREFDNSLLQLSLQQGDEHFLRLKRSLAELNQFLGPDGYQTFKTFFGYRRITTDLDIIVRDLRLAADVLQKNGWRGGPIQQGTMDLEKDGALTVGLHEKIAWDTPAIFDATLLWEGLREVELVGHKVLIPSPEVDIMSILAHIPFEKLYIDWGEMCYLFTLARVANLEIVMEQARKNHWQRSLVSLLSVMNKAHRTVFDAASPFEAVYPRISSADTLLPYECSFFYGGFSLIEIGAWKKLWGVVFDPVRMSYFFRGRAERRKISV